MEASELLAWKTAHQAGRALDDFEEDLGPAEDALPRPMVRRAGPTRYVYGALQRENETSSRARWESRSAHGAEVAANPDTSSSAEGDARTEEAHCCEGASQRDVEVPVQAGQCIPCQVRAANYFRRVKENNKCVEEKA